MVWNLKTVHSSLKVYPGVCAIQRMYVDVGNKACAPPFLGVRKRAFRFIVVSRSAAVDVFVCAITGGNQ